jgi:DNA polymerase, archaea type
MKIEMQVVDVDYFVVSNKPVVRIFGKTEEGTAVCAFYDKLLPYFYVKPAAALNVDDVIKALEGINGIRFVDECEKFTPLGYQDKKLKLLKITLSNPQDVPTVREKIGALKITEEIYEADIMFKYRFLIDNNIRGMQWIEIDAEREQKTVKSKLPTYRINTVRPLERNENAELRYLAFDIECIPTDATKPVNAKSDPIVMISLSFRPFYRGKDSLVLVAKPFSSDGVRGFGSEKEMLEEFMNIIDAYDPDVVTGYNINGFDFPYTFERMKQNKLPVNFGRSDKESFSRTTGISQEFMICGRVVADPYQILKRDPWMKFTRYDLKTVAKQMLQEDKHSVEYSEMPTLWNGTKEQVTRFIEYSRKDADLSMKLLVNKGLLDKFFELSKISGLLLQDTLGGQTRRIETMLMHEFKKKDMVMPSAPSKRDLQKSMHERETKGLKGATVLEPKKGLHAEGCILVLDFKSLYPSIMRTFNISPDSVVRGDHENVHTSPSGAHFIDESVYRGIFPDVLTKLTAARGSAKKLMKTKSGDEKRILNAKQLALKDMSNSFYGYTGYVRARLYMIDVANSVTSYGRENIEKTRKLVEENFDVEVVYGDTDSIFVKTKLMNLDEAKVLGESISKFITDKLPGHLELDFEKIYRTFLILTKKRYAGWRFDYVNGKWVDTIEMRGIETVRRDWCSLVSETMMEVLNTILKEGNLEKAIVGVKEKLDNLRKNQIAMEKLTIVKGITQSLDSYKGMLPHIELARKLAARNPQDAPKIGDRVGFVIIRGNQMLSKRAEDPEYIEKNKLQIDSDYYIESQLFPPIERIFSSVGIDRGEVFGSGYQSTFDDIFGKRTRTRKHEITLTYTESAVANEQKPAVMNGWDGFVCSKCNKSYRRPTMQGLCTCGGQLLISWNGSTGSKVTLE